MVKQALVVIDMQQVAFDGVVIPPVVNGEELVKQLARFVSHCRPSMPIVYLQTKALSGMPYAEDVHGWEIHPEIAPGKDDVIFFKMGPSGFENPKLDSYLETVGVTDLIICGIWSEGCVAFTCRDAMKRGFNVWLVEDGHSTVRGSLKETNVVIAEQNKILVESGVRLLSATDR